MYKMNLNLSLVNVISSYIKFTIKYSELYLPVVKTTNVS